MRFLLIRVVLFFALILGFSNSGLAQCAMCRTTIVNNVSHGELALAEGLNFGIMYLFTTPYLVIGCIAAILFVKYKQHVQKSR